MKDVTSKLLPGTLSRLETDFMRAPGILLSLWFGMELAEYLVSKGIEYLQGATDVPVSYFFGFTGFVWNSVTYAVFGAIFVLVLKSYDETGTPQISAAFRRLGSRLLRLLLVQFAAFVITFIGFLCLVIPGIYALIVLTFTSQVLVDSERPLTVSETLRRSRDIARPYLWDLIVLILVLILVECLPVALYSWFVEGVFWDADVGTNFVLQAILQLLNTLIYARLYLMIRKRQHSDPEQLELV